MGLIPFLIDLAKWPSLACSILYGLAQAVLCGVCSLFDWFVEVGAWMRFILVSVGKVKTDYLWGVLHGCLFRC